MTERLTLSYRTLIADHDQLLAVAGSSADRSRIPPHDGRARPGAIAAAWLADGEPIGFSADPAGVGRKTLHASYLHLHWAGYPELAQRFANAVHDHASEPLATQPSFTIFTTTEIATSPKAWSTWPSMSASLHRRTGSARSSTTRRRHLAAYPNTDAATKAIAAGARRCR